MGLLTNKVAFITGAASGLGAAMAEHFAQHGAQVVLADIRRERGEQVRDEITSAGGTALFLECDVTDADAVRAAMEQTAAQFGRLDIVCANAGINGVFAPIEELQPDEWAHTLDTNLTGTYHTVHFAVPYLKQAGGGSIIITSSINGNRVFAYPGATAYCVSKAAQVTFMKMMALELGRHNIRCNAICPGFVPSGIHEGTIERNTKSIDMTPHLPYGSTAINHGFGTPQDIANTALFLASDLSRHISGVEIYVDGGASLL